MGFNQMVSWNYLLNRINPLVLNEYIRSKCVNTYFSLLGFGSNGRSLKIFHDDVFAVGYPKSGNTWLNFLLACLQADDESKINFDSVENYVADIYLNSAIRLYNMPRPRLLKSHEPIELRYPKVIYIVRDPRAVAVSYYHHHKRLSSGNVSIDMDEFVRQYVNGEYDRYGTWGNHVNGWYNEHLVRPNKIIFIRYEDLQQSPTEALELIASFIGISISPNKIYKTLQWCSPDNMRALETLPNRRQPAELEMARNKIYFVRKANSNGWQDELSQKSRSLIEKTWNKQMFLFKYLVS